MKKDSRNLLIAIGTTFLLIMGSTSCSNTEIIDMPQNEDSLLSFNMEVPAGFGTRASNDHVLRYTARLFKGEYLNSDAELLQTKQGIASDGNCTITFSVPEGTYRVMIFADYVPINSKDASGNYPDRYYNLSSGTSEIKMMAFTTDRGTNFLDYHCINNDNYDCFSGVSDVIDKGPEKEERTLKLKRAVSKIRFVSNTDAPSDVTEIKFSKFFIRDIFTQMLNGVATELHYQQMQLNRYPIDKMSDPDTNELFYFYTFGDTDDDYLDEIEFTISYADGSSRLVNIPKGKVRFRQNYITTVTGSFLQDQSNTSDLGDIILYLSSDIDWNKPDISITQ